MTKHYDIIIIGGGMIGLAAALAFAPSKLSIAVIESKAPDFNVDHRHYDLRVIAINQATVELLRELKVWQSIVADRVSPYDKMLVWVDNSELTFSAAEVNEPELGFIVEQRVLRNALWQQAMQMENIELLCPIELQTINIEQQVTLTTQQGGFTSNLIIAADGANSWLQQQLNFALQISDYQQHALVTTVQTEFAHQKTAWQHFLPEGPLAFLPLDDPHHCSIVWSSRPEKIAQLKAMDESNFNTAITTAFADKLGGVTVIAPRLSFPLQMQHLKNYVSEHVVFIGDAAHRIHPLAGQGANLGFADVQCLAANIMQAIKQKKTFYALPVLQRYQRERKYYNTQMIVLMSALKNIFSTTMPTLKTLRNFALEKINHTSLIKNLFCKQAMR